MFSGVNDLCRWLIFYFFIWLSVRKSSGRNIWFVAPHPQLASLPPTEAKWWQGGSLLRNHKTTKCPSVCVNESYCCTQQAKTHDRVCTVSLLPSLSCNCSCDRKEHFLFFFSSTGRKWTNAVELHSKDSSRKFSLNTTLVPSTSLNCNPPQNWCCDQVWHPYISWHFIGQGSQTWSLSIWPPSVCC